MEEAALQDYRDKDVHSSRDFTAKVSRISWREKTFMIWTFETLLVQLYNGEKLPDTEGVVVKQGPQQNPFADSEFNIISWVYLFLFVNCFIVLCLFDCVIIMVPNKTNNVQNPKKLCGEQTWRRIQWLK